VAQQAGLNVNGLPRHEITVRNRREALAILVIEDVAALDLDQAIAVNEISSR